MQQDALAAAQERCVTRSARASGKHRRRVGRRRAAPSRRRARSVGRVSAGDGVTCALGGPGGTGTVHFIGAGPGAPDLLTLRARAILAACPVCLYAGSIVPRSVLSHCPPHAKLVDTAALDLDAIEAELVGGASDGQ